MKPGGADTFVTMRTRDLLVACTSCGRVARQDEVEDAGWMHRERTFDELVCGLCFHRQFSRLLRLLPVHVPDESELEPPAAVAN